MPAILPSPSDQAATLRSELGELATRFCIRWVASCTSTNSELAAQPAPDRGQILLLVADAQTAGRGRRGRDWQSWPQRSLTFSLQCRFAAGTPAPTGLSLAAGVAVAQTLDQLGVVGVQLKWPNDVLINGHKLGGILVELQTGTERSLVVTIGIGLNLQQTPQILAEHSLPATDLATALEAPPPPRPLLLAHLLRSLLSMLDRYQGSGFSAFKEAWEEHNAFANLPVRILGDSCSRDGICLGVDTDGALLLESEQGIERILSGDVSLRLAHEKQT